MAEKYIYMWKWCVQWDGVSEMCTFGSCHMKNPVSLEKVEFYFVVFSNFEQFWSLPISALLHTNYL